MQQPTSFLPRDNSLRILAAIVLLAAIAAAETLLAADMSGSYDYSLWPDDFLLACGEYERVRMFASRSPLLTSTVVAACGMLALMLSEAFWDRLRNTRRRILDAGQGLHAAGIAMEEITEGFRQLLAGLVAVAVIADLFILLSGIQQLQAMQPLSLSRYVALPLWLLREWLPGELREELAGFDRQEDGH